MTSLSHLPFSERAKRHRHPLARRLFELAEEKKSNVVLSADLTTTEELLRIADELGPHLLVLKTHIDILSDFNPETTIPALTQLSRKHNFLIFEDRKFIDIGNTVRKQYRGGALRIHDWAHIVNASVLPGPGVIQGLESMIQAGRDDKKSEKESGNESEIVDDDDRGILILAEMTSKGSLATGSYTTSSVEIARMFPDSVIGFVATRELSSFITNTSSKQQNQSNDNQEKEKEENGEEEDFLIFTTGVNMSSKGDTMGQQYQTPTTAMAGGSDFLIAGRGIYAAENPVDAVRAYREAGWEAYLKRIQR